MHYSVHKGSQIVSILSQTNSFHFFPLEFKDQIKEYSSSYLFFFKVKFP